MSGSPTASTPLHTMRRRKGEGHSQKPTELERFVGWRRQTRAACSGATMGWAQRRGASTTATRHGSRSPTRSSPAWAPRYAQLCCT